MAQQAVLELPLDEELLKVLSSDTRREMLRLLQERRMTGTELAQRLELGKPAVSEHLKKLQEADLIQRFDDPERRWVYYGLSARGKSLLEPQKVRFYFVLGVAAAALAIGVALVLVVQGLMAATAPAQGLGEEGLATGTQFDPLGDRHGPLDPRVWPSPDSMPLGPPFGVTPVAVPLDPNPPPVTYRPSESTFQLTLADGVLDGASGDPAEIYVFTPFDIDPENGTVTVSKFVISTPEETATVLTFDPTKPVLVAANQTAATAQEAAAPLAGTAPLPAFEDAGVAAPAASAAPATDGDGVEGSEGSPLPAADVAGALPAPDARAPGEAATTGNATLAEASAAAADSNATLAKGNATVPVSFSDPLANATATAGANATQAAPETGGAPVDDDATEDSDPTAAGQDTATPSSSGTVTGGGSDGLNLGDRRRPSQQPQGPDASGDATGAEGAAGFDGSEEVQAETQEAEPQPGKPGGDRRILFAVLLASAAGLGVVLWRRRGGASPPAE